MGIALITGATGFCGRHLTRRLRGEGGMRIWGLGRRAHPPADMEVDEYLPVDLTDAAGVATAVERIRPDLIFHLAGLADGPVEDIYRANVLGTLHLLDAARTGAPESRILLVGSAAEYGNVPLGALPVTEDHWCRPVHAYGVSKHVVTQLGLAHAVRFGMKVVVARPFNIVGAGVAHWLVVGAVLERLRRAVENGGAPVVRVGNLEAERDFVAVEDVVDAYVRLVHGEPWGNVFNICSGRAWRIKAVIDLLLSHAPRSVRLEIDPGLMRPTEVHLLYGSWAKAHGACGFRPTTSLEESLRAAWQYAMDGVVWS
jgi:GDP-4-dehydro-6-deoxy-D-mannose reductase